ncbi:hypothetical protein FOQG_04217 [Fusarium oxysporum f. sp. raphani 54005]|uniref:Uncharacterized protein n=6 Tax=Fusarium oxysporum TaxID=5507 RepID=X0CSZ6_FUSOX|nr:hypothetical protein FOXG_19249 [Fusarium oxysporum f. sp. lycopersici 4287]EWZ42033.1 hypothetical protein FOZG_07098 [Fusarium oxysporum Fo47]EXA00867.1 hypothetical protein FOWG_00946 [Fusarium oxysporum f. sp. lycopersici MN25]EXA47694.1 hypothetical protein FOVG_04723 [Fusarium oxysporum f. sp. pisi HDV247]EXK35169.1 hypothetical protein FOMG_10386 [Fusarium oxysporum f. sp. melonis 26406]EXK93994.1 hypothetical protein FOQG_04217 [Fusarium oxysporum f. sp. raphani 54005]EXL59552.1 hy
MRGTPSKSSESLIASGSNHSYPSCSQSILMPASPRPPSLSDLRTKPKGLTVHSLPIDSSANENGLPFRKRRKESCVRVVSSASSLQAVARGSASVSSTLPEMPAYLCLSM